MKTLVLALVVAAGALAARSASATQIWYTIPGNNCTQTSNTGFSPTYTNWGVGDAPFGMDVNCPVSIPYQLYTSALTRVVGYNRSTTETLSCTLMATDNNGANPLTVKTVLPFDSGPAHNVVGPTLTTGVAPILSVNCHIPGTTSVGASWLSTVWLLVNY